MTVCIQDCALPMSMKLASVWTEGYHTCLLLDVSGCRRAGWWRRAVQLHQAYGLMVMSLTRHTGGHYELYASTSPTKLNVQA